MEILHKYELKTNFYKANSGYIFQPNKGLVRYQDLKFQKIKILIFNHKLRPIKKSKHSEKRELIVAVYFFYKLNLHYNDFFIKKICTHAKLKKNITVGNLNTIRDYSWAPEIC